MKKIFTLFFLSISFLGFCQSVVFEEHFDAIQEPALPTAWNTSLLVDLGFRTDSSNFSDTYTGASGLNNVVIRNSDSTGTYSLTSSTFSTIGFSDLTVIWGSRVSNNYLLSGSTAPVLEISYNGGSVWNTVNYIDNAANSTWGLVNAGTPITLPAQAAGIAEVKLRWSVNIVNDPSGTYRMDDVKVEGAQSSTVAVTVRVNMYNETISPNGVYIVGDFQGNIFGSTPMTDIGGNIYQYVINSTEGSALHFRFVNGNTAGDLESVDAGCGVDNGAGILERVFNVGDENEVFGPVCFGQCTDCIISEPLLLNITFQVDMAQQTVSPNGVHIAGNFQGWNPATSAMTNVSGTIYSYTALVEQGTQVLYKFINGNTFGDAEIVPVACSTDDGSGNYNRVYFAGELSQELPAVCFSECAACIPDNLLEAEISLLNFYPNPSNGIFRCTDLQANTISVFDTDGSLAFSSSSITNNGVLDLTSLNSGIYIVRISYGNLTKYQRLIISK